MLATHNPSDPLDWFWVVLSFFVLTAILVVFAVPVARWVTAAVRRARDRE